MSHDIDDTRDLDGPSWQPPPTKRLAPPDVVTTRLAPADVLNAPEMSGFDDVPARKDVHGRNPGRRRGRVVRWS
jgi:hypothetical protein